jgi:thioredoxin reductase (NADPH)
VRDIVIIGGGPAGLTAAIYAARANLHPLVIEGSQAGGQLMLTTDVENYPGFAEGIAGPDLMQAMRAQAERAGAEFLTEDVAGVDFANRPFRLRLSGGQEVEAEAVVVATGASAKLLGVAGESRLLGRGVSTCATCDGFFFRNRNVVVVGGGDTAMEEALYLANLAQSVTVVHRRDQLRASRVLQDRAFAHPRIRFHWNADVVEIQGDDRVTGLRLRDVRTGEVTQLAADGIFIAIGHRPSVELFRDHLEMDAEGYLIVRNRPMSSVEGVFVAGDVHDHVYRQAVTAAGFGAMAAIDAARWLQQAARVPVAAAA